MMVLFVSRSEKKAWQAVRRILDSFADRIGDDVWQTVITEDGLETVRSVLRRHAVKNMAVACHWIRSRSHSELLWIVGRRDAFNENGLVPIASTKHDLLHEDWENGWQYLPLIRDLAAVAALLHDWGKISDLFQEKLRRNKRSERNKGDPYRHEWISCKLLEALVICSGSQTEDLWLDNLAAGSLDVTAVSQKMEELGTKEAGTLGPLPPVAALAAWLILSHHRLPSLKEENERNGQKKTPADTLHKMLDKITAHWGYTHDAGEAERAACFTFSRGFLWDNCQVWKKNVKKWAGHLRRDYGLLQRVLEDEKGLALREILSDARLSLMLADHYVSSLDKPVKEESRWAHNELWANLTKTGGRKQYLEEHIVKVMEQAVCIASRLPQLAEKMESAYDVKKLDKLSPPAYRWQDRAVQKIKDFRAGEETPHTYFVVNMASTGCGKTMANAKIMEALSPDGKSLRYVLGLGLRTLTLQTGDEYRDRIGLTDDDMAVLIGSSAMRELHRREQGQGDTEDQQSWGDKPEELLPGDVRYEKMSTEQMGFLDLFFGGKNKEPEKNKAFLYKPVLAATIDHLMSAVGSPRGGRYMLPSLRLMSSDLVIDEIDDFDTKDLTAIARLVHLAGMYGRNVVISSATIPPDLAEGMYRAYTAGLACYNAFQTERKAPAVVHVDEFKTSVTTPDWQQEGAFMAVHNAFVEKRIEKLKAQLVKRRGCLVTPEEAAGEETKENAYFRTIRDAICHLHEENHITDKKTGKRISIGVVRMANIDPVVHLAQYLLSADWPQNVTPRIMTYHSREILLLRHDQEAYLDRVLKRKNEETPADITDPVMRQHIDGADTEDVIFILCATPVEEVGRDHDFDWAVVEPSSYRSIIQLAGRVLRHRALEGNIDHENMAVLSYNLRGLRGEKRAFIWPGYETGAHLLDSHDLRTILGNGLLKTGIDAVPRISKTEPLHPEKSLVDLEHAAMEDFNSSTAVGPQCMNGWDQEYWWLTALPLLMNRFRESPGEDAKLLALYRDGRVDFYQMQDGQEIKVNRTYGISLADDLPDDTGRRLWIPFSYTASLRQRCRGEGEVSEEEEMLRLSRKFGEITIPGYNNRDDISWTYSDTFGLVKKEG